MLYNIDKDIKKNVKLGVQKSYISTTTNDYLAFFYATMGYHQYSKFLSIMIQGVYSITNPFIAPLIYNNIKNMTTIHDVCCFVMLHLDDGIPYIETGEATEILLPRGLNMEYLYSDDKYQLLLHNVKGQIGLKTNVTLHHVRVSLTPELKIKYQKKEKCNNYQVYSLKN